MHQVCQSAAEAFEAYVRTERRATWKKWIAKAKAQAVVLRQKAKATPSTAPSYAAAQQMTTVAAVAGASAA